MATLVKIWITRYVDAAGRRVAKAHPGAKRVKERSAVWYAQVKVGGKWTRTPLYTDKAASQQRLAEMVHARERGEAGLVDPHKAAREQDIEGHVADYLAHIAAEGLNPKHRAERERLLRAVIAGCEFATLADLAAGTVTAFLVKLQKKATPNNPRPGPASARTKETYRSAIHAFAQWCVDTRPARLRENPMAAVAKAKGEAVHKRRAESVENLNRLLAAAAERPLREALTVRRGPDRGRQLADVRPEVRARLVLEGRERMLTYKTALLTGLRQGEIGRLRVKDLALAGGTPSVTVVGKHDAKNKETVALPLVPALAKELAAWVRDAGKAADDPLFYVPEKPNKIFRRDLALAGIPYRDRDGRHFDFHSLRHCTDSYLNAAGVPPTVVMAMMRHKKPSLSLVTYNDPRMADMRRALDALPKVG